ncbi:glycosyltransferase [Aeromicrobium sp.]|uniref:glycosyltransferase n=1 Tax=Aeromicrobium sp. TaxID=1871063 RepID=UPI003D6BDE50
MKTRVLVDASNLRIGGGIQVAASFIDEIHRMLRDGSSPEWLDATILWPSSEVMANLVEPVSLPTIERFPSAVFDVAFSIFGPRYRPPRAVRTVMGFADGTLVYARPGSLPQQSMKRRARKLVRNVLARRSFRAADLLVTETEAVKSRVVGALGVDPAGIAVVPNSVSRAILDGPMSRRDRLTLPGVDMTFCYVTRAYPHKNLGFLGLLGERLSEAHGIEVRTITTLRDDEWNGLDERTRRYCHNIGPVDIGAVRSVYGMADAAIFPSLLESFSATPLEAMAAGIPLFASDRDFVRTLCADIPFYFDPEDADSAASVVAHAFRQGPPSWLPRVEGGTRRVASMPSAEERARAYLDLIEGQLKMVGHE